MARSDRPRKHRLLRRSLIAMGLFLLLSIALIAFLPAILSTPFGKERLLDLVRGKLRRPLEAADIQLSWTGPQSVEGLRIPSPDGFPPGKDLLHVPRAVLDAGLLGLIFSGDDPLRLEIEGPAVNLIRDSEGRFNFGYPPPEEKAGEKEKVRERKPPVRGEGGGMTRIPRAVSVSVKAGSLHYEDAALRTASDLSGLWLTLVAKGDEARLEAGGSIVQLGGSPGELKAKASARGLSSLPSGLALEADASADGVDLRPYRALLEEFFQVSPPERPVSGEIRLETREGVLEAEWSADAGFLRIEKASGQLPIEGSGRPAAFKVPLTADLAPAIASFGRLSRLVEGIRLAGRVSGSLEVTAPAAFDTLSRNGAAALAGATLKLDLKTEGFKAIRTPRDGSGGAGKAPVEFSKDLSFVLEAGTGDTLDAVRIESARLMGDGLEADLSAAIGSAKGAASPGDGARTFSLAASIDLVVPKLLSSTVGLFPEGLEAGGGSRIRLTGLTVAGEAGGGRALTETLSGKGRLEVSGPLTYRGFRLESESGDIAIGGGKIDLSGATAAVNGGRVSARELAFGLGPSPVHRADLAADGLDVNYDMTPILAYALPFLSPGQRQGLFTGKVQSALKIEGKGSSKEELEKSLRGGGMVRVRDGAIGGSLFFEEIEKILGSKIGEVIFSELGSDFDIGDSKLACSKVYLQGKEGSKIRNLGLKGATGFDGRLDHGVDLAALEETIGDRKIQQILRAARNVLKEDVLPLKLKGSLSSPKLALEPSLEKLDIQGILQRIPGLDGLKRPEGERPGGPEAPSGKKEGEKKEEKKPKLEDLLEGLLKKTRR